MVDSLSNLATHTLLNAHNQAQKTNAPIVALKSNAKATQAIIDQLQQTVEQGKNLMKSAAANSIAPSSNLPRGSLIDIVV